MVKISRQESVPRSRKFPREALVDGLRWADLKNTCLCTAVLGASKKWSINDLPYFWVYGLIDGPWGLRGATMSRDISHKFHSEPHTCAASANALHGEGVYAAHPKPRHVRKSTIQAIDVEFASFIHLDGSKEAAALTRKCSDHAKANARLISQCLTPQLNSWMCGPASLETAFAFLSGGKKDPRLSQSAILAHMQGHLPLQNGVGSTQMLQVLGRGLG